MVAAQRSPPVATLLLRCEEAAIIFHFGLHNLKVPELLAYCEVAVKRVSGTRIMENQGEFNVWSMAAYAVAWSCQVQAVKDVVASNLASSGVRVNMKVRLAAGCGCSIAYSPP